MFTEPIKHTRLKTMEELLNFSIETNYCSLRALTFGLLGDQIAFSDESAQIYVTPYRSEIPDILKEAGYKSGTIMFPGTDIKVGSAYDWLKSIADEENWAETYEAAFKIASEKGILPVEVNKEVFRIKEIFCSYVDLPAKRRYKSMITKFLTDGTEKNIATYIVIDKKNLLLCDEYGRTYFVTAKTVINDLVNAMIGAGYTRTVHPEKYVEIIESSIDA